MKIFSWFKSKPRIKEVIKYKIIVLHYEKDKDTKIVLNKVLTEDEYKNVKYTFRKEVIKDEDIEIIKLNNDL